MTFRNFLASAAVATATLAASTAAFAADNKGNSASATGHGTATLIQPITVAVAGGDLAFGRIVRPTTGTGHVIITNNAGTITRTASGDAVILASGTGATAATAPNFTIKGEGGASYHLDISALKLSATGASDITVALSAQLDGTTLPGTTSGTTGTLTSDSLTFGGTLGAEVTKVLYIGGDLPVASDAKSATYAGDFTVTATYE